MSSSQSRPLSDFSLKHPFGTTAIHVCIAHKSHIHSIITHTCFHFHHTCMHRTVFHNTHQCTVYITHPFTDFPIVQSCTRTYISSSEVSPPRRQACLSHVPAPHTRHCFASHEIIVETPVCVVVTPRGTACDGRIAQHIYLRTVN